MHKNRWIAVVVLFVALIITITAGFYTQYIAEIQNTKEFTLICKEIEIKITTRLHNHAQLLRSGASFFEVSDSVSRDDWIKYYKNSKIDEYLPGILGLGYSSIIPKNQLENHINSVRNDGFPEYTIYPGNDRNFYTSIIYLEPFNFRNKKAFGYDMYTEPVRRKAMEQARDYDIPSLTGKVLLVQEADQNLQAGTLMYVPVYNETMPATNIIERRAAIEGWVYSPYRMDDLMEGILGQRNLDDTYKIHLQIFDDVISDKSVLFDSQIPKQTQNKIPLNRSNILSIKFNNTTWILHFNQAKDKASFLQSKILIVLIGGTIISFLLFFLLISLLKTRDGKINAELISIELKENEGKIKKLLSEKELILKEVHHRIKNNFTSIGSLLSLQSDTLANPETITALQDTIGRVKSMAVLYENLLQEDDYQTTSIKGYLENLIDGIISLFPYNIKIEKQIIDFQMEPNILVSIGIIVNELITNIMKYAFIGKNSGLIEITLVESAGEFTLTVQDDGIGLPEKFDIAESDGFGLMIMKMLVVQLNGSFSMENNIGVKSIIKFRI